jgi:hypothetical protein
MINNQTYGFFLWGTPSTGGGTIVANVSESTVSGGSRCFLALTDVGHPPVLISLFHSVATGCDVGLEAEGGNATISASNSMVTENSTDWNVVGGAVVQSYGDNYFLGNLSPSGSPAPVLRQ